MGRERGKGEGGEGKKRGTGQREAKGRKRGKGQRKIKEKEEREGEVRGGTEGREGEGKREGTEGREGRNNWVEHHLITLRHLFIGFTVNLTDPESFLHVF